MKEACSENVFYYVRANSQWSETRKTFLERFKICREFPRHIKKSHFLCLIPFCGISWGSRKRVISQEIFTEIPDIQSSNEPRVEESMSNAMPQSSSYFWKKLESKLNLKMFFVVVEMLGLLLSRNGHLVSSATVRKVTGLCPCHAIFKSSMICFPPRTYLSHYTSVYW